MKTKKKRESRIKKREGAENKKTSPLYSAQSSIKSSIVGVVKRFGIVEEDLGVWFIAGELRSVPSEDVADHV
jgi:hypothetical protein